MGLVIKGIAVGATIGGAAGYGMGALASAELEEILVLASTDAAVGAAAGGGAVALLFNDFEKERIIKKVKRTKETQPL